MGNESDNTNLYREAISGLTAFARVLLEAGTEHDESWRRAIYAVPKERVAHVYTSLIDGPLGSLLFWPGEVIPQHEIEQELSAQEYARYGLDENGLIPGTEPLIADVPKKIELVIDEDKTDTDGAEPVLSFTLSLIHHEILDGEGQLEDQSLVSLSHIVGEMAVTRSVVMYLLLDSGYHGHCKETLPVEPEVLTGLLELLKANYGQLLPHLTHEEEEKIAEYRCVDTGKIFRYDSGSGAHVAADGTTLAEYVSPLFGLEQQFIDPSKPPKLGEIRSVIRYIPQDKQ